MTDYKPLSGSHRTRMRGGIIVECIGRYLRDHGPSTAVQILEGATYKNKKHLRGSRFGPTVHDVRNKLARHGAFEVVVSYKSQTGQYRANIYGLMGSYEDYWS